MRFLLLTLFSLAITACATRDVTPTGINVMSESAYNSVIEEYSDSTERYSGLYNTITMRSTLLNSKVSRAQVDQSARLFMWDQEKYNAELSKTNQKLEKETEIFLSFFTPTRKHDNLNHSKTLWRIFLDANGKRYEGKVTKIKLLTSELQGLYPYHNSFSTPYSVIFPIPITSIEKGNSKLTVTGPVGSATQSYPAVKD